MKLNLGKPVRKGKLIINGKAETMEVYRINIKNLYYNDENGRIATFMSYYNSKNESIDKLSRDEYNSTIMNFIKDSESTKTYNTTKSNIEDLGQIEAGIILDDGRVIDGNRRFTCLRDLYEETHSEKYMYFECFVLPTPINTEDRIAIKSLELTAQYGTDTKVSYNPIDRLADVYKDLVGPNKLFAPEEYVARLNNTISVSEVKKIMIKSQTMWDYLDFMGETNRWDIARDKKFDGPIDEISNLRRKIGESEWAEIYHLLFTQLSTIKDGDRTREIRKLIKIYTTDPEKFEELTDDAFELEMQTEKLKNMHDDEEKTDLKAEIVRKNKQLHRRIDKEYTNTTNDLAKQRQLKNLEDILKRLNKVDRNELRLSNEEIKNELINSLNKIEKRVAKLKSVIEND